MNTKKVVFAKLFSKEAAKTQKLSKQRKVQLSLADELGSVYEEARDAVRNTTERIDAAYELVSDLISRIPDPENFYQDIEGSRTRLQVLIDRAQEASNDLGIDPSDSIDGFTQARDMLDTFLEVEDAIANYRDDINPILSASGLR
jgi:hypothetical protein